METPPKKRPSNAKRPSQMSVATMDKIFLFILLWCIASTALLLRQFHNNNELQRQLSHANSRKLALMNKAKNFEGGTRRLNPRRHKKKRHHHEKEEEMGNRHRHIMNTKEEKGSGRHHHEEKNGGNHRHNTKKEKGSNLLRRAASKSNAVVTVNQFPFTRSLERFKRSESFYLYIVERPHASSDSANGDGTNNNNNNASSDAAAAPLQWSEVRWKDLVDHWGRQTTFTDLLGMATPLHDDGRTKLKDGEVAMQKKMILHCLPKAASTTLRRACYAHQKEHCSAIDFPRQQDPFGYRNIDDFFHAVNKCEDIDVFCVQGGDALMSVINYEGKEEGSNKSNEDDDEREPFHFVHMVPFRNFDAWVESAIKQIHEIDGNKCDRIDKLLEENCYGYRELYMELYPKMVLSLLIGMAFDANGKGISAKDKHHIMLYNYEDVDGVVAKVSHFFDMEPLPRTNKQYKASRGEGTCPKEISEKFHQCHDEALMSTDAIRDLKAERQRRKQNDRGMKSMYQCMRKGEC
mmetsp:Transcript_10940/g.23394  ORF Transcript_10940/g.23394 Transcript_10940/m.23394 type:complete len:519 (+) Transcript_10940:126-1682(+)